MHFAYESPRPLERTSRFEHDGDQYEVLEIRSTVSEPGTTRIGPINIDVIRLG